MQPDRCGSPASVSAAILIFTFSEHFADLFRMIAIALSFFFHPSDGCSYEELCEKDILQ